LPPNRGRLVDARRGVLSGSHVEHVLFDDRGSEFAGADRGLPDREVAAAKAWSFSQVCTGSAITRRTRFGGG
jgi:hypothetical protein